MLDNVLISCIYCIVQELFTTIYLDYDFEHEHSCIYLSLDTADRLVPNAMHMLMPMGDGTMMIQIWDTMDFAFDLLVVC